MPVKFEGFEEFFDWTSDVPQEVKEEVHDSLLKSAYKVERTAKGLVPVDTGRLKGSITTNDVSNSRTMSIEVGTDVEYGPSIEYGTYKMKAQPFLNPALNSEMAKIMADLESAIDRGVK